MRVVWIGVLLLWLPPSLEAAEFNYDESKVPSFTLPNPLQRTDGTSVTETQQWEQSQRPQLLKLVAEQVYGVRPIEPPKLHVVRSSTTASGDIQQKQVTLRLRRKDKQLDLELLMHLPRSTGPVPVFVGLNFMGNHTISDSKLVPITNRWVRNDKDRGYVNHRASEVSRGSSQSRWPIGEILKRGYGVATIYYGDIDPDFHDGFEDGLHALYADETRTASSWGSISAWAWGLSFAMDYFEEDSQVDAKRVIVMGHSRLGKTSLWAGATDPRFALVISNNSGCGGAALSRRRFGETVAKINTSFPHWFCDNFKQYNDRENECPVDQHTLIALIAPRPVLICSAEEDRWADPKGEFLSGYHAQEVYRLLGTDGMAATSWPAINTAVLSRIGYHMRPGAHDVKLQDWKVYMDFADKHLGRP